MSETHVPEVGRVPYSPMMPGWLPGTPEVGDGGDESDVGETPSEQSIWNNIIRRIRNGDEPGERPDVDPRDEPGKIIN